MSGNPHYSPPAQYPPPPAQYPPPTNQYPPPTAPYPPPSVDQYPPPPPTYDQLMSFGKNAPGQAQCPPSGQSPPQYPGSGVTLDELAQVPPSGENPRQYPRVTQGTARGWFPGYDAAIEEDKKKRKLNRFLFLMLMGLIPAVTVCGVVVIYPGVHSQSLNLVAGKCTLDNVTYLGERKSCTESDNSGSGSSSRSCTYYSCYRMTGMFYHNDTTGYMVLYNSYWDYDDCSFKGTLKVRDFVERHGYKCRAIEENFRRVGIEYEIIGTRKIDCFGNIDKNLAFVEHIASVVYIVTGCIPILLLAIVVVAIMKCGTPGLRFYIRHLFCFPYYLITDSNNAFGYACPVRGQGPSYISPR